MYRLYFKTWEFSKISTRGLILSKHSPIQRDRGNEEKNQILNLFGYKTLSKKKKNSRLSTYNRFDSKRGSKC